MDVFLTTIGCRLNEAELQSWGRQLRAAGHRLVDSADGAQVVIVNTCAVTAEAARKSRKLAGRLHRKNPEAKLVLTGCYAELEPEATAELAGVDLVINNHDKALLLEVLQGELGLAKGVCEAEAEAAATRLGGRTRAFVKVQDGCRNRCSFCVVTIARGEERSRSIDEVVTEVRELGRQGFNEVVLTGVHLGGYGTDLGTDLYHLVSAVLGRTSIARLRVSSLEPWDLPQELFALWQDERLGRHLHLPLQSGSDRILRRMARRCDSAGYRDLVRRAREHIPDLVLTTDVIVGFPGETDEDWRHTVDLVREIGFSHIHIFTYSPRSGTAAARMGDVVPVEVKRERSRELHRVAGELKRSCLSQYLGTTRWVLWEEAQRFTDEQGGARRFSGLTDNYLRCEMVVPVGHDFSNRLLPARLIAVEEDHLLAELDEALLTEVRCASAL